MNAIALFLPLALTPAQHPALVLGSEDTIRSTALGETRHLLVYLPNGYAAGEGAYPVVYLLDGPSNFKHTVGILHGLAESGRIPRPIVVGISNGDRWRDLTPSASPDAPTSGGSDRFLEFLASELVPWVDERYRTTGFRVLWGHSLGGLFALYALITAPEVFDGYVALSPSLEWDGSALLEDLLDALGDTERPGAQLYLALADERMERAPYEELVGFLRAQAPPSLVWSSGRFDDDDHYSIRVTGALGAARFLFGDWMLTSAQIVAMDDEAVAAHYRRVSEKYETPRHFDLMTMTDAGYFGVADPSTAERGMALFRRAVAEHPTSPYAHASLGEGYERTGSTEKALEVLEEALRLAEQQNASDLGYYRGHVARVRATLAKQR
jgi:predicted alpha/beta superfamily hydrolase